MKKVDFEELEKAQLRKIDALIDMLDLKETDSVLEIGCGWGAFAIRGVQVRSVSICESTHSTHSWKFSVLAANGLVSLFHTNSWRWVRNE